MQKKPPHESFWTGGDHGSRMCWLSSSRNEGKRTDGNHHEPYNHITGVPAEQTSKGHHRAITDTFIKDDKCTLSLWLKLSLLWYWLLEDVKVFKILKWEVNKKNKIINAQIRFLHVLTSYLHKEKRSLSLVGSLWIKFCSFIEWSSLRTLGQNFSRQGLFFLLCLPVYCSSQ